MLIIISDLHFTDGTVGDTIGTSAFITFREHLRDAAYDASQRSDGRYEPIKEFDLLLLGDIFDVLRSKYWHESKRNTRPWRRYTSKEFIEVVDVITDKIIEHNAETMKVFRRIAEGSSITLPPATPDGKPAKVGHSHSAEGRVPVKVNIHYMVGNHDWMYHLPKSEPYNAIRKKVVDALGLVTDPYEPFPHEPMECRRVWGALKNHKVFARHGDIYDSFNFEGERNASSLGDAVVVELLNQFPSLVEEKLGEQLPPLFLQGLREIDNVRPLLLIPLWIHSLLKRSNVPKDLRKKVKVIWDDLADDFLKMDFIKKRNSFWNPWDDVDTMQWVIKFSRGISLERINKVLFLLYNMISESKSSLLTKVYKEPAFINRTAQYFVYGHTHYSEVVPLDTYDNIDQLYFNTGTWRKVYELGTADKRKLKFIGFKVMNYVAFFKDDERSGRKYEVWSGHLGDASTNGLVHAH